MENFLKELLNSCSPSGYETEAINLFHDHCSKFTYFLEYKVDKMGNSVFNYRGSDKESDPLILLSAHIDEIGFQVQYITKEGMLCLVPLGGPDKKVLLGAEVVVGERKIPGVIGKKPIHLEDCEERSELSIKLSDCLVDIGASNKEEAEGIVQVGDFVTFAPNVKILGKKRVMSKGLDDKAGVFIISEVLRRVVEEQIPVNLSIVALVQEEEGLRGSSKCISVINPDIAINVDVTFATDEGRDIKPEEVGEVELGGGPVIMHGPDCTPRLVGLIKKVAKQEEIPYQVACEGSGGTDTSNIQERSTDCETALVSIPNRNMHTQVEICDLEDIDWTIELLIKTIKDVIR